MKIKINFCSLISFIRWLTLYLYLTFNKHEQQQQYLYIFVYIHVNIQIMMIHLVNKKLLIHRTSFMMWSVSVTYNLINGLDGKQWLKPFNCELLTLLHHHHHYHCNLMRVGGCGCVCWPFPSEWSSWRGGEEWVVVLNEDRDLNLVDEVASHEVIFSISFKYTFQSKRETLCNKDSIFWIGFDGVYVIY